MLRSSPTWGHVILREVDPKRCEEYGLTDEPWRTCTITVWVEWDTGSQPATASDVKHTLAIRHRGVEIARVETSEFGGALRLAVDWRRAVSGECFVAELSRMSSDRRQSVAHLHILRPLESSISFSRLLVSPSADWVRELPVAALHPRCAVDRGLGLEVELLTPAADEVDARRTEAMLRAASERGAGNWTTARTRSKQEAWRAALASRTSEEDAPLLRRCALWEAGEDTHLFPCPEPVPERMVATLEADTGCTLPAAERDALLRRMHFGAELGAPALPGTHKTEFRGPLPPHELNFARGAAAEIATFARTVASMGPTAAGAISPHYFSATSVHVHVNVREPTAAGSLLTARQILAVWLEWVRYDMVLLRLARPWVWREPWCGPLYATGPELAHSEAAWEQGGRAFTDEAANHGHHIYDVPKFLEGVHAAMRGPEWGALDEAGRVALLFHMEDEVSGFRPFKMALSRNCSLNLEAIQRHGTLEARRFGGSCDPRVISHYAGFVVSFVECFRTSSLLASVVDTPSFADGLTALQTAQEAATVDGLATEMASRGFDVGWSLEFLLEDACPGQAVARATQALAHAARLRDPPSPTADGQSGDRAASCVCEQLPAAGPGEVPPSLMHASDRCAASVAAEAGAAAYAMPRPPPPAWQAPPVDASPRMDAEPGERACAVA